MTTLHASVTAYFGTMCVGDEPAETLEQRLTRCYQLAGYALALGTVPHDATLVHGTIHARVPDAERIGHAWLELFDEMVWEPVSRVLWAADAWQRFTRAVVDRRYDQRETRIAVLRHEHWGPWDDVDENTESDK